MPHPLLRRAAVVALSVSIAGVAGLLLAVPAFANPAGTGLVISEAYVNCGSANASYINKFVDLYNPTPAAVTLASDTLQCRAPTSTVVPSGSQARCSSPPARRACCRPTALSSTKLGWGTSNSPEGTAPSGNSVVLSYAGRSAYSALYG
jgi:5'-nucleotidase